MLLGTMLGDGHLRCNLRHPSFVSGHGWCQNAYNTLKAQTLSAFVRTPIKRRPNKSFGDHWTSYFATLTTPAFDSIRDVCCVQVEGRWLKRVSPAWLARLDWEGVAWWVCDDGAVTHSGNIKICTHGFSVPEVELLVTWFCDRGIQARLLKEKSVNNPGTYYPVIRFRAAEAALLVEKIRAFVPDCMRYKITQPERVREAPCRACGAMVRLKGNQVRTPEVAARQNFFCRTKECRAVCVALHMERRSPEQIARTKALQKLVAIRTRERNKLKWKAKRDAVAAAKCVAPATCRRCKAEFSRIGRRYTPKFCDTCFVVRKQERDKAHSSRRRSAASST